jgi:hypothetical protein
MAILMIKCPNCQHTYQTLVMDGTKIPEQWHCSQCGGEQAVPIQQLTTNHPLEQEHGSGCLCCGGNTVNTKSEAT